MSQHLSHSQIEKFRSNTLEPSEVRYVGNHIAICDECNRRLAGPDEIVQYPIAVYVNEGFDEKAGHLNLDQQIIPYLEGELSTQRREEVQRHIEDCSRCARRLDNLREFKAEHAPHFEKTYTPVPQHRVKRVSESFIIPAIKAISRGPSLVVAASICAFFLVLAGWWWINPHTESISSIPPAISNANVTVSAGASTNSQVMQELPPLGQQNQINKDPASNEQAASSSPNERRSNARGHAKVNSNERSVVSNINGVNKLKELRPQLHEAVVLALASQQLEKPSVVPQLNSGGGRLLTGNSSENTFSLGSPKGTVVLSDRPEFQWSEIDKGFDYIVEVFDPQLNTVAKSDPISATYWTPSRQLQRGITYRWQVTAYRDGVSVTAPKPPAPEAKFKVIELSKYADLDVIRKNIANQTLALGIIYAHEGLLDDAEKEFRSLLNDKQRSGAAKNFLSTVQSWRLSSPSLR